ncbi:hypothetical protein [Bacillus sp. CGMCC 1.60114]
MYLSSAAKQSFQINDLDHFHIEVTRNDTSVISQVIWTDVGLE